MSLTKAQRAARRERILAQLRDAWPGGAVTLELQRGRKRPRVAGAVRYVATSGAFVLIADGGEPDRSIGERPGPLHVPVEIIRAVHR